VVVLRGLYQVCSVTSDMAIVLTFLKSSIIRCVFYIYGSVHRQSIVLNNQRDEALSSRIYYSVRDYSTCFGCFLLHYVMANLAMT
jgi:hypothetical protein